MLNINRRSGCPSNHCVSWWERRLWTAGSCPPSTGKKRFWGSTGEQARVCCSYKSHQLTWRTSRNDPPTITVGKGRVVCKAVLFSLNRKYHRAEVEVNVLATTCICSASLISHSNHWSFTRSSVCTFLRFYPPYLKGFVQLSAASSLHKAGTGAGWVM